MSASRAQLARRTIVASALVSVALAAALSAAGVFTEIEYRYTKYALSVLFIAVAALIVFGIVVPWAARRGSGAGVGLILSILGVLTVVAFWSGLPPVFAIGGIVLGYARYRSVDSSGRRTAAAAIGLGALALVLDAVAYGTDIASRF